MFNSSLCNAATIRYSQLKFGHMHLCGMDYKCFSPHCCKCNSFGCTAAIRCGNACQGPHSDSLYSGSEHSQFNSPRLVKREAGFPSGRLLVQTNYDALMTHNTTENCSSSTEKSWLNYHEDTSQGSLGTTHPLMLVIIWAKYWKNPSIPELYCCADTR